jgi:hypothetical protein
VNLKEKLTKESQRVEATASRPNSATALKAARTRFENAHRDYWEAVHKAWADVVGGIDAQEAAEKHGVDPLDIAEIAR